MKKLLPVLLMGTLFLFNGCKNSTTTTETTEAETMDSTAMKIQEDDCTDVPIYGTVVTKFEGKAASAVKSQEDKNWGAVYFDDADDRNNDHCYLKGLDATVLHFPALNNWGLDTVKVKKHYVAGDFLEVPGDGGTNAKFYAFVDLDWRASIPKNPQTDPNPPDGGSFSTRSEKTKDKFQVPSLLITKLPEGLTEGQKKCLTDQKNLVPILLPIEYKGGQPEYKMADHAKDSTAKFSVIFYTGQIEGKDPKLFAAAIHVKF